MDQSAGSAAGNITMGEEPLRQLEGQSSRRTLQSRVGSRVLLLSCPPLGTGVLFCGNHPGPS